MAASLIFYTLQEHSLKKKLRIPLKYTSTHHFGYKSAVS